jgi:hypothetical protein
LALPVEQRARSTLIRRAIGSGLEGFGDVLTG